jgi:hypothetical protein
MQAPPHIVRGAFHIMTGRRSSSGITGRAACASPRTRPCRSRPWRSAHQECRGRRGRGRRNRGTHHGHGASRGHKTDNRLILTDHDLTLLLLFLRANNKPGTIFPIANGLIKKLGLSVRRLAAARRRLQPKYVCLVQAPDHARHRAALYRWAPKNPPGQNDQADSSLKGNTISPHWKGWCDGRRLHTTDGCGAGEDRAWTT